MESGDDISPLAHTWGVILAFAGALILLVITVGAFAYDTIFGLIWLFLGVPITGAILYALGLVIFAPVALISGGFITKRATRNDKTAILSHRCTMSGLIFADGDRRGYLDLRDDGLLFHNAGKSGQLFSWEKLRSFGVGEEKGIVVNTSDGHWLLVLSDIDGDEREEWVTHLTDRRVAQHVAAKIAAPVDAA